MGCSEGSYSGRDSHCVIDVVRGIVKAQQKVAEAREDTCKTSCDRSIEDLLSPSKENRVRSRHNTIPFILFCRESCKPFVGTGIVKSSAHFKCVESPVFRVKNFVRGSNSCVRVELLKPVAGGKPASANIQDADFAELGMDKESRKNKGCNCGCGGSVCDYFPSNQVRSFRPTGICITVDLNAFFGISCLDPITIR